jgi:hypothetical protein
MGRPPVEGFSKLKDSTIETRLPITFLQSQLKMLSHLFKPSNARSVGVLGQVTKNRTQARLLATVQHNTARQTPAPQRRSTSVSTERATFTIKVCAYGWREICTRHSPLLRTGRSLLESRLAPRPMCLAKPSSPPHLLATRSP